MVATVDYGHVDIPRFLVPQGGTISIIIPIVDAAGVPVNISAFAANCLFEVWDALPSTVARYLAKSITAVNANATLDGAQIAFVDADTIAASVGGAPGVPVFPAGDHVYEIWRTDGNNDRRLAWGLFPLAPSNRRQETT